MMSLLMSLSAVIFPPEILDEIWDLIWSVSEGFSTYFFISPTFNWLPKLHKQQYKARFIANSSSCTTIKLSKLLTSCLTAIKNMLLNNVKKSMKGPVKIIFGHSKNSCEV